MEPEKQKPVHYCEKCGIDPDRIIPGVELKPFPGFEEQGFWICPLCETVYSLHEGGELYLYGEFHPPKGAVALIYAREPHGEMLYPKLEFCEETITVDGVRLNCIREDYHKGARMHQARCIVHGVWVEVTWDLGAKAREAGEK